MIRPSRSLAGLLALLVLLGPSAEVFGAVSEDLDFANPPVSLGSSVFGQNPVEATHGYDPFGDGVPSGEDIPISTAPGPSAPPPPLPPPPPPPKSENKPQNPVHTVVPGDTLWAISARYCGSGPDWRSIYEANRDKIKDPHWIYPGQQFRIACPGGAPAGMPPGPSTGKPPTGKPDGSGNQGAGGISSSPLPRGSYRVSSEFGPRRAPNTGNGRRGSTNHQGIDLAAPKGTPVLAAGDGIVEVAELRGGYGYAVYLRHPNGWVTRYGHMLGRLPVRVGMRVKAGQKIGLVGSTGNSSGPHLHFETRKPNGTPVNPRTVMRF